MHKNGEWFAPGKDLLKFISDACDGKKLEIGVPLQKGIFFSISDELNAKFHAEIERRLGRKIKRGDLTAIGNEMIENWIGASL